MTTPTPPVQPQSSRPADIPASSTSRGKYAGKRLGKFQIVGELGRGGMGVVFEARDTVLERNVAIKMLPRSVAARPEALERFLREARAAAKLHHPHVVAVYDADHFNGQYYIVLELVRGGSLQDSLKTGPLTWVEATRVVTDACRGLEVAHRAGLVHRDIKPSNLMRSEDGTVKLADFGLVRPNESTGTTMTGSGSVLGTPQYMSPEQCRSERADERSDLYAMGATYYALLTGQPPYPGDAPLLVMNAHLLDPIPDPRDIDASIAEGCSAIIRRAMAKDPDDRHANAAALIADLEELLTRAETADGDTSGSQSWCRQRSSAVTARSATTTEPGSFLARIEHLSDGPSQRVTRLLKRRPVWSLAIVVATALGWWMLIVAPRTDSPAPNIVASDSRKESTNNPAKAGPGSDIAMPPGSFQLPGMRREPQPTDAKHDVWSMDYPGISRVHLANSGEFLVVLTNTPAQVRTASWQGQVTVWSREGKKLLVEPVNGRASSGAISSDSTRLAVGTTGGQGVLLWNTKSWSREPSAVAQVANDVESVALSHDGRWLAFSTATSSKDGMWVLWNVAEQKESQRHVVKGSGNMRAVEFAPGDDLLVVTGGSDGIVRHWRGTQAELSLQTFNTGQAIHAIACQPGGHLQATGYGKHFSLWDYQRNVRTFLTTQLPVQVDDVAFSPDGQRACVTSGALVEIMDADTGRTVDRLTGFGARVLSVAHTPNGEELFTASANGKLKLWSLAPSSNVD
ncbi:MAG: protein kinase [Planctomycetales bacterium]|nr:protein kinase [Planctomycetales bacterium]